MPPTVDHIANISFEDHFLSDEGTAPVNGRIQVNNNTFDVTFVDGKVNAKFVSGNWFTNFFRTSTLARFTQTGFIAAFAIFAGDRFVVSEFPSAFEKFAAFAQRLTDRLDAERSGYSADSDGDAREASAADPAGFDFIHV